MSDNDSYTYLPVVTDNGPTSMGVGVLDDRVVVQIAEPPDKEGRTEVHVFGMTPEEAVHIAMALMRSAVQLKPELGEGLPA